MNRLNVGDSMKKILLALTLLFWTSACSPASIFDLTPTPTLYVFPTPETPVVPALTVDALRNAEYTLTGFDNAVHAYQFLDGKYAFGGDPTVTGYADIKLLDTYAFGDLNNDGVDDAAVLIAENYGGTGVFVSLNAVLNEGGRPRHAASTMIDDRPKINLLSIRGGVITLDATIHGVNDPACCPEWTVTRSYKLSSAALTLVRATTHLPSGQERAINIESPTASADVQGRVTVAGSVTIAPFENTLVLHAYNEQGNELFAGPIMVNAPDLGAPGTFTTTLDASAFSAGRIRIVVTDLSAADGSILALDSVEVIVK